jgi:hypothetical protein
VRYWFKNRSSDALVKPPAECPTEPKDFVAAPVSAAKLATSTGRTLVSSSENHTFMGMPES